MTLRGAGSVNNSPPPSHITRTGTESGIKSRPHTQEMRVRWVRLGPRAVTMSPSRKRDGPQSVRKGPGFLTGREGVRCLHRPLDPSARKRIRAGGRRQTQTRTTPVRLPPAALATTACSTPTPTAGTWGRWCTAPPAGSIWAPNPPKRSAKA